jgi:hypothetical protein
LRGFGVKQQRAKRHHYVPQALQKSFADGRPGLWYSRRDSAGKFCSPEWRNFTSAFQQKNYYTVLRGDQPSDIVERDFYAPLDDYLARLIADLRAIFDAGGTPKLVGDALPSVRRLVAVLMKRTPEFLKSYDDDVTIGRQLIDSTVRAYKEADRVEELDVALPGEFFKEWKQRQVGRDIRVSAQVSHSERLERTLSEFAVRWGKVYTRHSFVLSSLIVLRIGNGGPNGLLNPLMEIWLPITPNLCLVMTRDRHARIPYLNEITRDHLRQANEYATSNCNEIASASKKLLLSLTR